MKTIYVLDWTEFESGWGCRPDGIQLFLDYSELEKILENNKKERNESKSTPLEYSIPTTKYICEIDIKDFNKIKKFITKSYIWFSDVGKRDIQSLEKTYPSLKIIATENLS